MPFVKELIQSTSAPLDRFSTFDRLIDRAKELHLQILEQDRARGVFCVRFLSLAFNMILWKCWSDKILFHVIETGARTTEIRAYAIPNFFRMKTTETEKVGSATAVVKQVVGAP